MAYVPVDSSNIEGVNYSISERALDVYFKSGAIYTYFDVDEVTYEQFMTSTSKGKFFNSYIKDMFTWERQ